MNARGHQDRRDPGADGAPNIGGERITDREKPGPEQRLTLRKSTERAPDGKRRWEATYEDYIDVEGHSFPTNVRFVDDLHGADTQVRVKSISLNPDVPEGAFQQTPSPGMSVELATCS